MQFKKYFVNTKCGSGQVQQAQRGRQVGIDLWVTFPREFVSFLFRQFLIRVAYLKCKWYITIARHSAKFSQQTRLVPGIFLFLVFKAKTVRKFKKLLICKKRTAQKSIDIHVLKTYVANCRRHPGVTTLDRSIHQQIFFLFLYTFF